MASAQRRSRRMDPKRSRSTDSPEIEKFAALAGQWWDPQGPFAALHRLNPLRLQFIRAQAASHFRRDQRALALFDGLALVDVGCGGGLLTEPLARQGFDAFGIDPAAESIAAAAAHAHITNAKAAYRCATAEILAEESRVFDVVVAMEVIEHVADRHAFVESLAALLKPGGLLFLATINRTLMALMLAKFGAEYALGWIPPGTHEWSKFISPDELSRDLENSSLSLLTVQGVSFDPFAWEWRLSSDLDVNYMLAAAKFV